MMGLVKTAGSQRGRGSAAYHTRARSAHAVTTVVLVVTASLLAACGSASPDAAALLRQASTTFAQATTFHFTFRATQLGPNDAFGITQATGDVQRPAMIAATGTVTGTADTGRAERPIGLLILGPRAWFRIGADPYQLTTTFDYVRTLFDAWQGLGVVLMHLQHPSTPQDVTAGATPCWQIAGEVEVKQLIFFGDGSQVPNRTVHTSVCVGKADGELYAVTFTGPVAGRDTAQTMRTFTFSAFGKPVTIKPPATPAPTA
jgi:hypothetical protein